MSVWLRKTKGLPGSAPGGLEWHAVEDVVEVEDDALAGALLEIPDAGFVSVAAPEAAEDAAGGPEPDAGAEDVATGEQAAAPRPARKTAASRAKTPVSE